MTQSIFLPKVVQRMPISYAKFQRDPPCGSAAISEKLMGVAPPPTNTHTLARVKAHGIKGEVLNCIEQWLFGREQRFMLNGCKSEWKQVIRGVPQGSVLDRLLFIISVNTIEKDIDSKVLKFADDVKVFRTIESGQDQDAFQSDLDRIFKLVRRLTNEIKLKKA